MIYINYFLLIFDKNKEWNYLKTRKKNQKKK